MKGFVVGGDQFQVPGADGNGKTILKSIKSGVRNLASVLIYLDFETAATAWTQPANGVELVAKAFDDAYWTSGQTDQGTPLVRPPMPAGVSNWGLRTLWCYW